VEARKRWRAPNTRRRYERARNQSLFRTVNERVEQVNQAFRLVLEDAEFICECANDDCMERIRLTVDEYHDIRRIPTHFFVKPGHVYREFERVIQENGTHVVVEKFGVAGKAAVEAALATLPR
jgi:predicted transcriptional regulator